MTEAKYRVTYYQDGLYEVTITEDCEMRSVFKGALADCEAFVRLCLSQDVEFVW